VLRPGPAPATIDLHSHTIRSDGLLEPAELARAAADCGVRLLAITDHDSLAAYRELSGRDGPGLPPGLELVPGVEINAVSAGVVELPGSEIHVLGLGVDPSDDAFEATLMRQRGARRIRFERTIERLRELGLAIDEQVVRLDLTHDDALGRPTIARALIEAGHATSVDDAFARILGRGTPAYVPRDGLGPLEAIRAIRAAHGLPVLAHFGQAPERRDLIAELVEAGLAGLEAHHRSFDDETAAAVADVARGLGLFVTGGTDYHGDVGPYAMSHADLRIPDGVETGFRAALGVPSTSA
jgi:predicted metal-dependent phosphoesterase TrpH